MFNINKQKLFNYYIKNGKKKNSKKGTSKKRYFVYEQHDIPEEIFEKSFKKPCLLTRDKWRTKFHQGDRVASMWHARN